MSKFVYSYSIVSVKTGNTIYSQDADKAATRKFLAALELSSPGLFKIREHRHARTDV